MATFVKANPTFSTEALAGTRVTKTTSTGATVGATVVGAGAATGGAAGAADQLPAASSTAGAATAAASSPLVSRVFIPATIDVSANTPPPTIVRDGKEVTAPAMDPARVDDFLTHTVPIVRFNLPVAVSQSIPAGTRVAKGTPVDLVFATVSNIPFNVFDAVHADLATKTVADVLPIAADPQIAPLLSQDPTTLTAAQKATVTTALTQKGIKVDDADPTRTFNLAFASLKSVQAFQ